VIGQRRRQRWIDFSEGDGKSAAEGANIRRQSRVFCQRVRTTRSTVQRLPAVLKQNLRFNAVTKYPRKILDKVVVLDKGSAGVNAPLPLHGEITIRY
jgi:hypothetical protein